MLQYLADLATDTVKTAADIVTYPFREEETDRERDRKEFGGD